MGSDNKKKKQYTFGKFGKVIIRESETSKEEEQSGSTLSASSATGIVIGSVTIAAGIYSHEVRAGATGVPY